MNKIRLTFSVLGEKAYAIKIFGLNVLRILLGTMDVKTLGDYDVHTLGEIDTNNYGEGGV